MSVGSRPYTENEIQIMLKNLHNNRDKCFFILGIKTGFRVSELLSIKVNDVIEYNKSIKNTIVITASRMKGKVRSRGVPIGNSTRDLLKTYIDSLPEGQVWLFGSRNNKPLSRIQMHRIIKDASIKSGLTGKVSTHSSRKTFAKAVYERSKNDLVKTSRAMGHANVSSTMSYLQFHTHKDIDNLILGEE